MKLVIASNNPKKIEEMRRILEPMGVEPVYPAELGVVSDADETGATFRENAYIKARDLFDKTGLPAIADDSGLCVDALGGKPGIFSARYGGEDTAYPEKMAMLLEEIGNIPKEKRTARFACAICCIFAEDEMIETGATCEGWIGTEPIGSGGFGWDPLLMVDDTRSFATLSAEEKDAISHRGGALRRFEKELEEYMKRRRGKK